MCVDRCRYATRTQWCVWTRLDVRRVRRWEWLTVMHLVAIRSVVCHLWAAASFTEKCHSVVLIILVWALQVWTLQVCFYHRVTLHTHHTSVNFTGVFLVIVTCYPVCCMPRGQHFSWMTKNNIEHLNIMSVAFSTVLRYDDSVLHNSWQFC